MSQKRQSPADEKLVREPREKLPLLASNFKLMAVAGAMIVIGFLLMAGGSTGWDEFNPDIFSTRRIVIGPLVSFLGFIFMGFAIMYSPKSQNTEETTEK
ncbi:MAG: DUF3098 domain-containing protein [Duncaniella sp.]|nr:DUF3098 domain-containing protein [Duncaniella sp.]